MKLDGIEVINAVIDEVLEVTQDDVDHGVPLDHHACSIARAWRRHDPTAQDVWVGKSRAYKLIPWFGELRWARHFISNPIKMQEAILDNGGHMSPGKYTLKAPPKGRAEGVQEGTDTRPDKPKKPDPTLIKTGNVRVIAKMRANAPTSST